MSHRLAPVSNAPIEAVRRLAKDDDISVAGPVLEQSPRLPDSDLVDIARTKSQAHLLAISGRTGIAERITDELVRRGDRQVVRGVADNREARLSDRSFSTLVSQAEEDGILAEKVGMRPDIPPRLFRDLLLKATEVVQQRLLAAAKPDTQAEIRRVLARVSNEVGTRHVARLQRRRVPDRDAAPAGQAQRGRAGRFRQGRPIRGDGRGAVAACAWCRSTSSDRLMGGDRPDPILILCKSAGWEWPTVKALIMARPGNKGASSTGARYRLQQFRAAVAGDRAARDAVLAGAPAAGNSALAHALTHRRKIK